MIPTPSGTSVVRPRSLVLGGALLASAALLMNTFGRFAAPEEWLFFRYAACWAGTLAFVLACLSVGNRIVSALSLPGELQDARIALSFSTGVYVFFVSVFLVGIAGGLTPVGFVLVPVVLFALGARQLCRDLLAYRERARGSWLPRFSAAEAVGVAFGAIALAVIYLPTLIPENAAYDSRWYHLGIAEHYAAEGAIRRFPEGPLAATIPQLAPVLYAWAFTMPGADLFNRVELAAHLEFVCFLFTVASVPALVRYLVPGARARLAGLAFFFFPSVFTYDSSLFVAADHIAALFAIPAYLALARAFRELRPGACAFLVIQLCGLVMTKYTTLPAAIFPILAVGVRTLHLGARSVLARRWSLRFLAGPAVALGLGLVLTTPHWLKNWVWYGDPFYPLLRRFFTVRPWTPDSEFFFQVFSAEAWAAVGTPLEKLEGALRALYNYSLHLYNWPDFHKDFPIFGSLFTFGLIGLVFLGPRPRLWVLVLATHLGIVVWFLLFQHERYLQALVPWMASAIAAIALLAWRTGWAARIGVVALGTVQLVWGLDMIFWPLHRMTGKSGPALASEFFARSYERNFLSRVQPFEDLASIGRELPKDANVLLHQEHLRLGLGTRAVWDALRMQMGISYGSLGSARNVHRRLRELGVTHVLWASKAAQEQDTIAGELAFHTYVSLYLEAPKAFGARSLGRLPDAEPPEERPEVLYIGCSNQPASGLYQISDLHVQRFYRLPNQPPADYPAPRRPFDGDFQKLVDLVDRIVVEHRCADAPNDVPGFVLVAKSAHRSYFARELRPN